MSNHSSQWPDNDATAFRKSILDAAKELELGETRKFPFGKLDSSDEGEIRFAVAADKINGKVILNFGKPVAWMALTAENARELAKSLLAHADELP